MANARGPQSQECQKPKSGVQVIQEVYYLIQRLALESLVKPTMSLESGSEVQKVKSGKIIGKKYLVNQWNILT